MCRRTHTHKLHTHTHTLHTCTHCAGPLWPAVVKWCCVGPRDDASQFHVCSVFYQGGCPPLCPQNSNEVTTHIHVHTVTHTHTHTQVVLSTAGPFSEYSNEVVAQAVQVGCCWAMRVYVRACVRACARVCVCARVCTRSSSMCRFACSTTNPVASSYKHTCCCLVCAGRDTLLRYYWQVGLCVCFECVCVCVCVHARVAVWCHTVHDVQ